MNQLLARARRVVAWGGSAVSLAAARQGAKGRPPYSSFHVRQKSTSGHRRHQDALLHPKDLKPILPMPASLSPTSIGDFLACHQSFLFQHLYGLKPPLTPEQKSGVAVHSALEKLSQLPPADRNIGNLRRLYRQSWQDNQRGNTPSVVRRSLSSTPSLRRQLKEQAKGEQALQNYMRMEAATTANAVGHEVPVGAFVPAFGRTSLHGAGPCHTFQVCGRLDRLNVVRVATSSPRHENDDMEDSSVLEIVDVKRSPPPSLDPTFDLNHQLNLFKLHIYSLLLHEEQCRSCGGHAWNSSVEYGSSRIGEDPKLQLPVRFLNLPYLLPGHDGRVQYYTHDMGSTPRERKQRLGLTRSVLQEVHRDMVQLVLTNDPKAFQGCDRPVTTCVPALFPGRCGPRSGKTRSTSPEGSQ
jgi:PD-(D/E)XK nuclease superfamily